MVLQTYPIIAEAALAVLPPQKRRVSRAEEAAAADRRLVIEQLKKISDEDLSAMPVEQARRLVARLYNLPLHSYDSSISFKSIEKKYPEETAALQRLHRSRQNFLSALLKLYRQKALRLADLLRQQPEFLDCLRKITDREIPYTGELRLKVLQKMNRLLAEACGVSLPGLQVRRIRKKTSAGSVGGHYKCGKTEITVNKKRGGYNDPDLLLNDIVILLHENCHHLQYCWGKNPPAAKEGTAIDVETRAILLGNYRLYFNARHYPAAYFHNPIENDARFGAALWMMQLAQVINHSFWHLGALMALDKAPPPENKSVIEMIAKKLMERGLVK
ncbi:MAG: hypothetical protein AB7G80_02505 [Dongiaceae bacterium]